MKKTLLIGLLLITNCSWAKWIQYSETDNAKLYYESESVKRSSYFIKVWTLNNYKHKNDEGELSAVIHFEIDCNKELINVLSGSKYDSIMGEGKILWTKQFANPKWSDIPPETPSDTLLKNLCKK